MNTNNNLPANAGVATFPKKLPKLEDLYDPNLLGDILKDKELIYLLNNNPPSPWIKKHPYTGVDYIPIGYIEFALTKIFGLWWIEIREVKLIANSIVVTIRLNLKHPHTGETIYQDGVGAQPLQTDKGAGATDFNAIKSNAVSLAAPAAESYAVKDAAEKLGKLFGKDLTREHVIQYEKSISQNIANIEERAKKAMEDE